MSSIQHTPFLLCKLESFFWAEESFSGSLAPVHESCIWTPAWRSGNLNRIYSILSKSVKRRQWRQHMCRQQPARNWLLYNKVQFLLVAVKKLLLCSFSQQFTHPDWRGLWKYNNRHLTEWLRFRQMRKKRTKRKALPGRGDDDEGVTLILTVSYQKSYFKCFCQWLFLWLFSNPPTQDISMIMWETHSGFHSTMHMK